MSLITCRRSHDSDAAPWAHRAGSPAVRCGEQDVSSHRRSGPRFLQAWIGYWVAYLRCPSVFESQQAMPRQGSGVALSFSLATTCLETSSHRQPCRRRPTLCSNPSLLIYLLPVTICQTANLANSQNVPHLNFPLAVVLSATVSCCIARRLSHERHQQRDARY